MQLLTPNAYGRAMKLGQLYITVLPYAMLPKINIGS